MEAIGTDPRSLGYERGPLSINERERQDTMFNMEGGRHHAAEVPGQFGNYQRRRRGNLPKEATKILKDWFEVHTDSPYPQEDQKNKLAAQTGLCMNQVS